MYDISRLRVKRYRTIILSVFFSIGVIRLSLKSREERRLSVFENRVLRRVFGPKRDEVTGELRKLHNDELHDLDPSSAPTAQYTTPQPSLQTSQTTQQTTIYEYTAAYLQPTNYHHLCQQDVTSTYPDTILRF
jgi:hypothetical protein